ncbi:helix-turn-helix transcriptional regulator [Gordonia sp. CPCC 205333]|uniref:helix-turn-helix transcriptional regulator n=1 Tax=Gordonia sp. CPCC 205333 TaxID=3140790 RepID=UPI003AF35EA8
MARNRTERLLNLVICLREARQFVTAEFIRENVVGYADEPQSDEAFNRMFERDKAELRDMGVPLLTGAAPRAAGVEGYRIDRESYELPEIVLDEDEAAAVAMAAVVWDSPDIARLTQSAVLKLKGAGIDVRVAEDIEISPRRVSSEPVTRTLIDASTRRQAVTFAHRPSGAGDSSSRTLEPWGVLTHRGRWYVIGHDRDRDDQRVFRLSRVTDVRTTGRAGAFEIPAGVDLTAAVAATVDSASGADGGASARLWVAADRAVGLRRIATAAVPTERDGVAGDEIEVPITTESGLARMVLSAGRDVVVLEPKSLRDNVISALDAIIAKGV